MPQIVREPNLSANIIIYPLWKLTCAHNNYLVSHCLTLYLVTAMRAIVVQLQHTLLTQNNDGILRAGCAIA